MQIMAIPSGPPNNGVKTSDGGSPDETATHPAKGWLARHRRVFVIASIVVAVAAVVIMADWYQQKRELRHLETSEQRADRPISRYRAEVRRCAADQLPCFATPASLTLRQVSSRGRGFEDVSILPWHGAVKRCRNRLANYYRSWEQYLRGIVDAARRSSGLPTGALNAKVDSSFRSAQRACDAALPPLFSVFDAPMDRAA